MAKRVPPHNSFTTDDGNPDDKRPRREDVVSSGNLSHPSSSGQQYFSPNELPSSSSTTSVLSSANSLPSPQSNGNLFATNGSNGHHHSNGVMLLPSMGHTNNFGDMFSNGNGGFPSSKCSICLWPVGSPRCYHNHSHHRPHQLSTR